MGKDGKKILICSNIYPPHFVGGAELIAHNQAKALAGLGHDVTVFAGDPELYGNRYDIKKDEYEGITVYRIKLVQEDYQPEFVNFSHQEVEKCFKNIIDAFTPEVVHFHNVIGLSVGLISIAKNRGIKTVVTLHDYWGFCYKNTSIKQNGEICRGTDKCGQCMSAISSEQGNIPMRMRKDFFDIQMDAVDNFISPSQYLANAYTNAGFPADKLKVLWNGIDVQRFSSIHRRDRGDKIRFTYIGYFGAHKGISTLLDALSLLDCKENIRINLVGTGDQIDNYQHQLKANQCKHLVKFWGKIPNNQIEKVYAETDVLVLPSIWPENQPVSITEAMAARIPVIASRMGGNIELVEDGNTGYLFDAGDAGQLAQKMRAFFADPAKLKELGENAYNRIANKSFSNQVEKIIEIYDNVPTVNKKSRAGDNALIVCIGDKCNNIMNMVLSGDMNQKYEFVMGRWLENDQLGFAKLAWVVDNGAKPESILFALKNKIPLLVPEDNIELKKLCSYANCGLYYQNEYELVKCIDFLFKNSAVASKIGYNGYKFWLEDQSQHA